MNKHAILAALAAALASPALADSDLVVNPANGHTYARFDTSLGWHEAAASCAASGGYLATIGSQDEQDFVYDTLVAFAPFRVTWLGGSDAALEGDWGWLTGEPWTYSNWGGGEPNDCGVENYLQIFNGLDGRAREWNDSASAPGGGCICGDCAEGSGLEPSAWVCEWDVGAVAVAIDVKPGTLPNAVNLRASGTTAVAVLGSAGFRADQIDLASVRFAGAPVASRHNGAPMAALADANGDGLLDAVLHFETAALQLADASTSAALTGRTVDGTPFGGSDSIVLVP